MSGLAFAEKKSVVAGLASKAGGRAALGNLRIGEPQDQFEREADRVADEIVAGGSPKFDWSLSKMTMAAPLRRKCSCGESDGASGKCDECKEKEEKTTLQRKAAGPRDADVAPPIVHEVLNSPGQPLDKATRDFFEPQFGHDFSKVRVHADSRAHESARAVNALAYTVGNDLVFGAGQLAPGTNTGMRLLAHELVHVAQQGDGFAQEKFKAGSPDAPVDTSPSAHEPTHVVNGSELRLRRTPDDTKPKAAPAKKLPTAADAPKLDVTHSKNGEPCACVVVVHNDEANARKTAQLMFENCSYNLALLNPANGSREITIPGHAGTVDPNSLFPKDVAEPCIDDDKSCRDFVAANANTTDTDKIEKVVQTQFFLAIKDCSASFALPVVALHNNAVEDTAKYREDKGSKAEFGKDVDKSKKETGEDVIDALKKALTKRFGKKAEKKMVETKGQTNIFRWCASKDLSRCHIGDPDHPDNITWVTNPKDFDTLSKKPINVALQSDTAKSAGSESEGDLSTLFLLLRDIRDDQMLDLWLDEVAESFLDPDSFDAWLDEMQIDELTTLRDRLRYINIETPGKGLSDQTDAERARNYDAIVDVLKAAGLHCCGTDPTSAENKIKEGLKVPKPKPKKSKPKK